MSMRRWGAGRQNGPVANELRFMRIMKRAGAMSTVRFRLEEASRAADGAATVAG